MATRCSCELSEPSERINQGTVKQGFVNKPLIEEQQV